MPTCPDCSSSYVDEKDTFPNQQKPYGCNDCDRVWVVSAPQPVEGVEHSFSTTGGQNLASGDVSLLHLDKAAALAAMVRKTPPAQCRVIDGSTPVVAFGDYESAEVATLGINPSKAEFLDTQGRLLIDPARRLATLPSLGADHLESLTDPQVEQVLSDCRGYFHRNPFGKWFNQLNLPLAALGANYYDGTACHLDVSMWATDPVWGGLDASAKKTLLLDGEPPLRWLLTRGGFSTVVVNGKTAWQQLEQMGLVTGELVGSTTFGPHSTKAGVLRASIGGTRLVGWSCNVQAAHGMTTSEKTALGATVMSVLSQW